MTNRAFSQQIFPSRKSTGEPYNINNSCTPFRCASYIINLISYTCAFPALTNSDVWFAKDPLMQQIFYFNDFTSQKAFDFWLKLKY